MADDVQTFQIGTATDLVQATLVIDNTAGTVTPTLSLLSGNVRVPVNVTTATLGAGGAVNVAGTTLTGDSVTLGFTEGQPTATVNTNILGVATNTSEAVVAVCFASGTLIRTARGAVAVEDLAIGDLAVTASGAHRPIRWLGHRVVDCRRHPRPQDIMPVRVVAHAFGESRPARDLVVSPGHSLCIDVLGEVLIPASSLINGSTIVQEDVDSVTYWHVELDSHDVIFAEDMPAESYLEMGNRGFFADNEVVDLVASPDALVHTHADFCRPFHIAGVLVDAVRAQLAARARQLGWHLVQSEPWADVNLFVDGRVLTPKTRGLSACFEVSAGARDIWLVAPTGVPREADDGTDDRELGLCLSALTFDDGLGGPHSVALADPRLGEGFHGYETTHRWTSARARLPADVLSEMSGTVFLRIDLLAGPVARWVGPVWAGYSGQEALPKAA